MSDEVRQEIKALWKQGRKLWEIAEITGQTLKEVRDVVLEQAV